MAKKKSNDQLSAILDVIAAFLADKDFQEHSVQRAEYLRLKASCEGVIRDIEDSPLLHGIDYGRDYVTTSPDYDTGYKTMVEYQKLVADTRKQMESAMREALVDYSWYVIRANRIIMIYNSVLTAYERELVSAYVRSGRVLPSDENITRFKLSIKADWSIPKLRKDANDALTRLQKTFNSPYSDSELRRGKLVAVSRSEPIDNINVDDYESEED